MGQSQKLALSKKEAFDPFMRRYPLILLVLGTILFGTEFQIQAAENQPRPNVLFLFADDQRADTIAALGNPLIQTPNLDKLVRNGVSFRRAYMQGAMQGATCVPSRAMLLSGQSLFHIDEKLLRGTTWPEAFAKVGYTTFISGKWHNGDASVPKCFQIGRSLFTGGMADPLNIPLRNLEDGKLSKPTQSKIHGCEVFANEAIQFLNTPQAAPFLCYLPFDAPHDPHIVPEDFPIKYDAGRLPLPANFLPQHPFDNGEMKVRDEVLLPTPRTPDAILGMLADYYRYISYLDFQIGRVLEALDKSAFAKNTIVVFSADSGVARGSHGLIGKQNLYEHSLRVPLVISGPGIPENKSSDAMCYLFDVFPTLGSLCRVAAPVTSEGMDFSAALRNPTLSARKSLRFAYKDVQVAVRDEEWKLIHYPKVDRTQLFDLKKDPFETHDLSDSSEQKTRVARMREMLAQEP